MSYSSRYRKKPHEELREKWDSYDKKVDEINKILNRSTFAALSEQNTAIGHMPYGYDSFKQNLIYIKCLFLLPLPYKQLTFEELVAVSAVPAELKLPRQPELNLPQDEYPPEYFESKNSLNTGIARFAKDIFNSFLANEETGEFEKSKFQLEIEERREIIKKANILIHEISKKWDSFTIERTDALEYLRKLSDSKLELDVANFLKIVDLKHELPAQLRDETVFQLFKESQTLVIQFKFPDLTNKKLVSEFINFRKPKLIPETRRKKIIKQCLYSMMIRLGNLVALFNTTGLYKSVVINAEQDWFDPATGQERNGIIATLQAPTEYLQSLNLSQLDPEACFKHLKGIAVPSYDNINPVRPIFELIKEDDRFVESKNVSIEDEANLAAMPWEDFEHLVAQIFEWEFAKSGVEIRVTRASRDRGVDAILFDPDPLRGGKYVLQAKRYTRTVDVSAVRDLYGTVMNEGANRGILITTSSYGSDSYEFAKDKPISLVDGPNLLLMLQKHGKRFKIDLEEARRLNEENKT